MISYSWYRSYSFDSCMTLWGDVETCRLSHPRDDAVLPRLSGWEMNVVPDQISRSDIFIKKWHILIRYVGQKSFSLIEYNREKTLGSDILVLPSHPVQSPGSNSIPVPGCQIDKISLKQKCLTLDTFRESQLVFGMDPKSLPAQPMITFQSCILLPKTTKEP